MDATVSERIKGDITSNDVVLYMKGSPVFPQCGFSAAVVQVLTHLGVKFKGIDILQDPSLRQGIKEFSQWPVRRRLRHHPRDVRQRRAAAAPVGQGCAGQSRLISAA
jgi:Grx4 family monothiol glutaredoxin